MGFFKMQVMVPGAVVLFGLLVWTADFGRAARGGEPGPEGFFEVIEKRITLRWKVDGERLRVILSAPTTGWVSVGFAPEREMKGANIIIGYVKADKVFIRDDFGDGNESHQSDTALGGTDNVSSPGGSEINGVTEISFVVPLDSEDPYDAKLAPGDSCRVILAYGPDGSDNFEEKHRKRTRAEITIR